MRVLLVCESECENADRMQIMEYSQSAPYL